MGMPSPGWDSLAYQRRVRARRRKRRWHGVMLLLLTCVTAAVLVFIAVMVKDMAKVPTGATTTALSSSARVAHRAPAPASTLRKPSPQVPSKVPRIADTSAGLSYQLLSSPWSRGCPSVLNTPMFSWSAGERAVAGQVTIGGSAIDWHGLACSGQLQQQFQYAGPADLEPTAMGLVSAFDSAYYAGLQHYRTLESSSAMQVSGHQAWVVRFLVTYPDAAGQGLAWTSEAGAVVVVDRGPGQPPAVFYVSVPSNLGTSHVSTLIGSLRLS
jgi:hypothetical protein